MRAASSILQYNSILQYTVYCSILQYTDFFTHFFSGGICERLEVPLA